MSPPPDVASRVVERSLDERRAKGAREVDALLRAGERVLARRGYAGMRVDDVLAEANLSTRAFYRHFRGRSELFLALFDAETARAETRLREKLANADGPEEQVRIWIDANVALAFDPRLARRTRLFLVERAAIAAEFRDDVRRCVRAVVTPLEDAIAAGRDAGAFHTPSPTRDAVAIHQLCTGLLQDELLGLGELTGDEAAALVTRFALTTLRAEPVTASRPATRRAHARPSPSRRNR